MNQKGVTENRQAIESLYFFRSTAKTLDDGTGETDGEGRFRASSRAGKSGAQLFGRGMSALKCRRRRGRRRGWRGDRWGHCRNDVFLEYNEGRNKEEG